jgi:hypothetical protein
LIKALTPYSLYVLVLEEVLEGALVLDQGEERDGFVLLALDTFEGRYRRYYCHTTPILLEKVVVIRDGSESHGSADASAHKVKLLIFGPLRQNSLGKCLEVILNNVVHRVLPVDGTVLGTSEVAAPDVEAASLIEECDWGEGPIDEVLITVFA